MFIWKMGPKGYAGSVFFFTLFIQQISLENDKRESSLRKGNFYVFMYLLCKYIVAKSRI